MFTGIGAPELLLILILLALMAGGAMLVVYVASRIWHRGQRDAQSRHRKIR